MVDRWRSGDRGRPASRPSSCWRCGLAAGRSCPRQREHRCASGGAARSAAYAGSVDGLRGRAPRRPCAAFSGAQGLAADGIVGPLTRRTLGRRGRPAFGSRLVGSGDRGWDVAALQFLLAWRGFPSGAIDGGFGAHTEAALVRYQRWAGLSADGRAGPATLRSLQLAAPRAPATLSYPVAAALGDRLAHAATAFTAGSTSSPRPGRRYARRAPGRSPSPAGTPAAMATWS